MRYLKQFMIIALVSLVGEIVHFYIPLPVPASIYGLVIMLFLIFSGIVKVERVKGTASFLLEIMPVMFIPTAVGIIAAWKDVKRLLLPLVVISTVTTALVFLISGKVTDALLGGKDDE